MSTRNHIISDTTAAYLDGLDMTAIPSKSDIALDIVTATNNAIELYNATVPKGGSKYQYITDLMPDQLAQVLTRLHHVCRIPCGGVNASPSMDLLGIYMEDGPDSGTYVTDDDNLKRVMRQYNPGLRMKEVDETVDILRDNAPRVARCEDPDLIAVNNGIFDYRAKTLRDFTPDLIFLTKSRIDYKPNPVNPIIHNADDNTDWDVEDWMRELSDDPEIVNLFWEILGAIIRPFVPWNKSAWFYSNTGNNGKGTLCALMRNLCGPGSWASIPLSDFSKDFMLEPLTRSSAIIVDENDVGGFIDRAANIKAVITGDALLINRKFKAAISFEFKGFMVQCINDMPRLKDKSDSFYRRQLFVPFTKCFTGIERKYIKSDYLKRTDVLEYVLHRILHSNYYALSEPVACRMALEEYKDFNDPIRQYAGDILPQLVWDFVPFGFLYDVYKVWFKQNSPSGSIQGRNTFINDLVNVLPMTQDWVCQGKNVLVRVRGMMDQPEPLIAKYDLNDWKNPTYTGGDWKKLCMPVLAQRYRGIMRAGTSASGKTVDEDEED